MWTSTHSWRPDRKGRPGCPTGQAAPGECVRAADMPSTETTIEADLPPDEAGLAEWSGSTKSMVPA